MDPFWAAIDSQLDALKKAGSADDVIRVLTVDGYQPGAGADAFFAGSGGDESVEAALAEAGWLHAWREAYYHWAMRAPDGSVITYIEGDIYRGNRPPLV